MTPYPIQIPQTTTYFRASTSLMLAFTIMFFGLGLVLLLGYFTVMRSLPRRQAESQRLWVDGDNVRFDGGVYFLTRSTIPLERITDFVLAQGPLQRWVGVWSLAVQTAGSTRPEAIIYGLENPERVREELVAARAVVLERKAG